MEHILVGRNKRRRPSGTRAQFFDVAKALDNVWHKGLFYEFYLMGVLDRLVFIICDFLSNCRFHFRAEGTLSTARPLEVGVLQGSVLLSLYIIITSIEMTRHENHVWIWRYSRTTLYCILLTIVSLIWQIAVKKLPPHWYNGSGSDKYK